MGIRAGVREKLELGYEGIRAGVREKLELGYEGIRAGSMSAVGKDKYPGLRGINIRGCEG